MYADELPNYYWLNEQLSRELNVRVETVGQLHPFDCSEAELRKSAAQSGSPGREPLYLRARRYVARAKKSVPGLRRLTRKNIGKLLKSPNAVFEKVGRNRVSPDSRIAKADSGADFVGELERLFDDEGQITAAVALIDAKRERLEKLQTGRQQEVVNRVLGGKRMMLADPVLPPRSLGAAYVSEPDRVLYCAAFTPAFNSNGYAIRTRGVVEGMLRQGKDVVVVARPGYPWDNSRAHRKLKRSRTVREIGGVRYVHVPQTSIRAVGMDHFITEAADVFVREARRYRPQVIQSASNYRMALPALIAARRVGVPFVYEVRGLWEVTEASNKLGFGNSDRYSVMARLEAFVAKEADGVIALSEQLREELVRRGVERNRISLAPNAVDLEKFYPRPFDAEYAKTKGIRDDIPIIGFAGSMAKYEGVETLLEASCILKNRGVTHQVVLAGSGSEEKSLRLRAELPGNEQMKFLGRLPAEEIPRLLSTFDISALPRLSLPVTELVPALKPLEAAGSGIALVLSDVAPHRTVAGPNRERGLLFEPGNAQELADKLESLIIDESKREALTAAARRWTLDARNWDQVSTQILHAISEATRVHANEIARQTGARTLGEMRVLVFATSTTEAFFAPHSHVERLSAQRWRQQLADPFDLLVIDDTVAPEVYAAAGDYPSLNELIHVAKAQGIRIVFAVTAAAPQPTDAETLVGTVWRDLLGAAELVLTCDARWQKELIAAGAQSVLSWTGTVDPHHSNPLSGAKPTTTKANSPAQRVESDVAQNLIAAAEETVGIASSDEVGFVTLSLNEQPQSPTMFSLDLVENAAAGRVVLSAPSVAVDRTFEGIIPATENTLVWKLLLEGWAGDDEKQLRQTWQQLRSVYRSHLDSMMLGLVFRSAGIAAKLEGLPSYGLVLRKPSADVVRSVSRQSVRPTEVFVDGLASELERALEEHGIVVRPKQEVVAAESEWLGAFETSAQRTHYEDLLLATRFGQWDQIIAASGNKTRQFTRVAMPRESEVGLAKRQVFLNDAKQELRVFEWHIPRASTGLAPGIGKEVAE